MAVITDVKEELLKLFKEEKLVKNYSLDNYSRKDFLNVESIVDAAIENGEEDSVIELCEENLKENEKSVYSLYAIGLILLKKGSIDTYYLPELIKMFNDAKKFTMVIFLAEKVLSFREEKYALRILEEYYRNENRKEDLVDVRERLVRVDSKDAYIPKSLAEYYEEEGNIQKAVYYYRISLDRFIALKNATNVELIFEKLLSFHSYLDVKYLISVSNRLLDLVSHERIGKLLHKFALHLKKREMYDSALQVLKFVLSRCTPNDAGVRNDLRELYEIMHPNHSLLSKYWNDFVEFLRSKYQFNARVSPDEIISKLNEFEKKLKFDIGVYVYHRTFGVGQIVDIEDDWIVIDFNQKKNHRMSNNIAFSSLDVLSEDDIRIWQFYKKDELQKLIDEHSPKVIKMILVSFGGKASAKEIKEFLSDIMPESMVNKFWNSVKLKLGEENIIVSPENKNVYMYVSQKSLEDNLREELKSLPTFSSKMEFVYNFLQQTDNLNIPQATPIVEFLRGIVTQSQNAIEVSEAGVVLIGKYQDLSQEERGKIILAVQSLKEEEIIKLLERIENNELKKVLLTIVRGVFEDWDRIFMDILLRSSIIRLNNYIFSELVVFNKLETIKKLIDKITQDLSSGANRFNIYFKYVWIAKLVFQKEYEDVFNNLGLDRTSVLINVINILSSIQSGFEERGEKGVARRIYLLIKDLFSNYPEIEKTMLASDKDTAFVLLSHIYEFDLLDLKDLNVLRSRLYYKYPDLKDMEDTRERRSPFLITKKTFEKIREEYNKILNEELPKISKLVASNPNPELVEKEEELKAIVEKLSKELSEYQIIHQENVSTDYVDVGTKVILKSKKTGEEITYHILGEKDADPSKNIIYYRSPLGIKLLDKYPKDIVKLNITGVEEDYEIVSISLSEYV
ncbi:MAG: GreA/GreB family elongation factor [Brevinematia bacterium]